MELWIRSQDKRQLVKVCDVKLNPLYLNEIISNYKTTSLGANEYDKLGSYKTTERTLEVLDEIHQRLIDLQILEIFQNSSFTTRSIECVYQMPSK